MERKRKETFPVLHKAQLFNILANSLLRFIIGILMNFLKNTEVEVSPGASKVMGSKPSKVNDMACSAHSFLPVLKEGNCLLMPCEKFC